LDIAHLVRATA